ncbi:MAG: H+/Na+-translocating ferredoxin:NAD+ oxidoreductase subunit, partial [Thermodesulfobacteriota bacterium]|nr:H+/Na+-translocating ferredoxin:NAD+ oxidoreductase subunit [Thermodesulfobacteriota bacterium]
DEKAPDDLKIFPVYRYVITSPQGETSLGYVLPLKGDKVVLVELDLSGKPIRVLPIDASISSLADQANRDNIINGALPKGSKSVWAQTIFVADRGGKRLSYVVPGVIQGFKTFIKLMVSLTPDFTVSGVAVTYSEEDPGLGAEIQKDFFRNQFVGKTLDLIKKLSVVKEPLPADYASSLDPVKAKQKGLTAEQVKEIKAKHLNDDIYALTGATISSRALTKGVVNTVQKFVKRLEILDEAIRKEQLSIAF